MFIAVFLLGFIFCVAVLGASAFFTCDRLN